VTAEPHAREAPPRMSVAVLDVTQPRWSQALQSKMRVQDAFVLGTCLVGIYFTASLIKHPMPRMISLGAIIAIAAMIAARAVLHYARPNNVVAWPYPVIALLSAGPAYGFGLHAGFAAIVAAVLFSGRLFRSPQNNNTVMFSIIAVVVGHGGIFVLVMTGVFPDTSNLPLHVEGLAWYAPFVHHAMVQALYIATYIAGGRFDREFVRAAEIAREAYAEAVRADARLEIARTELDAALRTTEGLFTGTAVGPYQLGRLLGRGGMGEVYQAEGNGKLVALKLLRADRLGDPVALERFAHEAKLLMRIDSPHCARVLDVSDDRALPYLAMEYVDGPSLSTYLRGKGRMDTTELIALIDDLARALGDVHASGVVHLDLKPSNVLRDSNARWKIVDFGIARMLTGEGHRKVAGTPPYMAPEQALGEDLDTRTDVYSLSLILYRAITGRPAFVGADSTVIANRARTIGPPDPRMAVAIEDDVALVLRIGLAANIADRFADAAELRNAFIGALGGRLDPRIRARGRDLLARAPWAPAVPTLSISGSQLSLRSTR
jgi:tRNA A-37 threonylcarbamoyl transferase component Bud32